MHELVFFTSCILTIAFVAKIMIELEFPLDDQSPKKAPTESSSSFLGRFKDIFVFSPSPDIRKSVFALDDIVYAGLRKIKRVAIGGPEGARCENFPRAKRCRPLYFSPTVIDGKPVRQVITRELEIGTECHVGSVGISDVFPLGDYDVTNQNLIKFDRHQHQIPQNYVSPLAYDIIIIRDLQLDSSESGGCTTKREKPTPLWDWPTDNNCAHGGHDRWVGVLEDRSCAAPWLPRHACNNIWGDFDCL